MEVDKVVALLIAAAATVIPVVVLLKRAVEEIVRKLAVPCRAEFWREKMRSADSYKEWLHASEMALTSSNVDGQEDAAEYYDEELVRSKVCELRRRRNEGEGGDRVRDMMFGLKTDLFRNLGNACNPELQRNCRFQVPGPIKEYINETTIQLKMICHSSSDDVSANEKLSFMKEARSAFGRTALLLSGGGSLGAFHVGVVRTLLETKLLPQIIAGSSAGSIVSSIVATHSPTELYSFFDTSLDNLQFFPPLGGALAVLRRILGKGAAHDILQLKHLLRKLTGNMTFQEAYEKTGILLCITVSSLRSEEPSRCLNYLTSPHVVIWSAVSASCSFPGLFEPQELTAKDRHGMLVPYHPPIPTGSSGSALAMARLWRDGTLQSDLPILQLKELFGVNNFIVSQANPHITPLLRLKEYVRANGGNFAAKIANLVEMEMKHRLEQMLELGFPIKGVARFFAQDWEGDITLVMPATFSQYARTFQNPSREDLDEGSDQGRRCAWEKLSSIKVNSEIELVLDECVSHLTYLKRLHMRSKDRC